MKVLGLKNCDTCRKALKALREDGHEPEVIDVRADGLSSQDISAVVARFGEAAINRSSTTWRQLAEDERAKSPEALLTTHPTLMKRPVICEGEDWTIGWKADAQDRWLASS